MAAAREDTMGTQRVRTKDMLPWAKQIVARRIGPETTQALRVFGRLQSPIQRGLRIQPASTEAPPDGAPQTRDHYSENPAHTYPASRSECGRDQEMASIGLRPRL